MSRYWEEFEVGARYDTYSRTLTEGDSSLFCALVGYHVPLFIDEEYARKTVHGGRIIPSSMIMAVSTGMTESLYRTTVVAQLGLDNAKFLKPVKIGDTIRTTVEVVSKRETSDASRGLVLFRDHVTNQRGEEVFVADKPALIARRPQ